MKQIFIALFMLLSVASFAQPAVTEVYLPKYVQGVGNANPPDDRKVPYVSRMQVTGLTPNATYRYYSLFGNQPTGNTGVGAYIVVNQSGNFQRVTAATLAVAGRYQTATADASGSFTAWFIIEPSSDISFAPGSTLYWRIFLNNGNNGSAVVTRITAANPVTVLGWGSGATQGSGLRNTNTGSYTAKNFVLLWDNVAGTGRPETGTFVEDDGTRNLSALNADPTNEGYAPFYGDNVDGVNGAWGTIIPNNLSNGIANISQFSLANGALLNSCTAANGVYGSTNTANAAAGLTALTLSCSPVAPALGAAATATNVACFGGSTGTVTATGTAGTPPYAYTIAGPTVNTTGATTGVFTGLAAGAYTVTVTDAASGSATATATVSQPTAALSASAVAGTIACFGGSTTGTVTATGGTGAYSYVIASGPVVNTTGAANGIFTGLTAGQYTFTVTDANSCTITTSPVTVAAAPAVLAATAAVTSPIVTAGGTGTITATTTGGTAAYSYTISGPTVNTTGATSGAFSGLSAGSYTITVTDARGCTVTTSSVTLTAPGPLTAASSVTTAFSCALSGIVTVTASGGVAPYSGTGAKTITAAGSYTYTVTDAQGATATTTINVAAPTGCATVAEVLLPKFVQGVGSGEPSDDRKVPFAARMTINGLTPNATYRYYNQFVINPTNGSGGSGAYIVANQTGNFSRVTAPTLAVAGRYGQLTANASGSATAWFIVEPSSQVEFTPGNQLYLRVFLNNGSNGTTVATRTTSTAPVTVLAFGTTTTTGTGVRATNAAYTPKNFIMLYNNEAGTGRPEAGTFVESDGTRNLSALDPDVTNEGYAPFYGDNVDGVAGAFGTIIPNNLSTGIRNITQYTLADGAFVNRCTSADGVFGTAATANTNGGLTPQVVSCTPFAAATIADPAVGQMNFTTLAGVSQSANTLLFTQAYKLNVPFYNLNQTTIVPNGTITVRVNLGSKLILDPAFSLATAPLNNYFAWTSQVVADSVVITGTQIADIPADFTGTLSFDVRGEFSCTANVSTNINIVNTLAILQDEDLQNNAATLQYTLPVTVTTTQVNVTCNGAGNGIINAVASPGATVVIRNAANAIVSNTGLVPGVYTVTATATGDAGNTCSNVVNVTIVQPLVLTAAVSSTVNNICNSGNAGSVTVASAGGTAPYTYVIAGPTVNTTGANTGIFTGLMAGNYTITSTDANGCTATTTATITQPTGTAPDISLGSDITGSLFTAAGSSQTIVYNVTEIAGNPSVGDTIRITKVSGFTISFNSATFSTVVSGTTYTLDNARWKIDNSDPSFVSIILTDPAGPSTPGTLLCNQRVNVAVTLTRNTTDVSTFTLSARLRKSNGELNLSNNLNSVILAAE
ncbi:SprB repeat-containing protein [Ferruginibacter sp. HRS2-29]|uniref:beta strand repeat-containing protein n=1 Tax=Ferruginibacter sp. HRS2-29 TaxID=2487334 RepID=UPI0020CEE6D4|nr:SprB repeat-containing protein [Ferruginibacter sp. HRS2-29]MCP9751973.1 hypothetical protein [Ferruginibacter sp. HRS2-29]